MKPGRLSLLLIAVAAILFVLKIWVDKDDRQVEYSLGPSDPGLPQSISTRQSEVVANPAIEPETSFLKIVQEGLPTPECEDLSRPPLKVYDRDYAEAERQRASAILAATDDASLILAAALLTAEEGERVPLLQRSFQTDPSSKLTMWHLVQECFGRECGGKELLDEAVRVDGDNAAIWIERARAAIRQEDWAIAEIELQKGIAAPRYDIYFLEQVMLVERALAAGSNFSDMERSVAAFGIAAATAIPQYGDLTKACQSETNDTNTWAAICDQLGELMAVEGGTMIDHSIGIALRRIAAERIGDAEAEQRFQLERDAAREIRDDMILSGAAALAENDYAFFAGYLDHFAAYGELRSFQYAASEARRLRADPTYDQCNFVLRRSENP